MSKIQNLIFAFILLPTIAIAQGRLPRLDVDNLRFDGNTISTTNTNGDLILDLNGTGKILFTDLTSNTVPYLNSSKYLTSSSVTPTELGYLSGVTSSIQTQLNSVITASSTTTFTNKTFDADGTGNSITNIENADIKAAAAIALNKLAATTASRALVSDGSGFVSPATTTSTEIGYVNGVTSSIQTQLDDKVAKSTATTKGDFFVATGSGTIVRQGIGSDGQILTADSSQTNGLKWAANSSAPSSSDEISNCSLAASVSSNALTIALKDQSGSDPSGGSPCKIGFRNATLATGTYSQVSATAATSLVISSGSTLGHVSGATEYILVYAINNSGTIEITASTGLVVDQGTVFSTTAEGGAGAADSRSAIYSTTARSNVAGRLMGRIKISEAVAGTWATAPSEISLIPFNHAVVNSNATVLERIERATVTPTSGASCTINKQSGTWITATSPTAAGDCTLTITGFSDTPSCTITTVDNTAINQIGAVTRIGSASSTSIRIQVAAVDETVGWGSGQLNGQPWPLNIICMGPR